MTNGSGRPVIRGFDGDRVLVLQDGLRLGGIASQSADEVEPIDVLSLDRVEIVKGPATLLYGSNVSGKASMICCAVHRAVGWAVTLKWTTCLLSCSSTTKQYKT